jgi:mannose-1-phosphate guanylyltransferase
MKALLLAAGFGTRLRPLTDTIPKCLVEIKGQPLLDIWLARLSQAGVGPYLVNTHYLSSQVQTYIAKSSYSDVVTVAHEEVLRGTAGTTIKNIDFFQGEDGLLIHADNYCLADFKQFIDAHKNRPPYCLMTMMTFRTDTPETCGIVELNPNGVVMHFHEKTTNPPGNLANGAVYALSAELLNTMATQWQNATDFSTEILPRIIGKIFTYETKEFFLDIGTPEAYHKANLRTDN